MHATILQDFRMWSANALSAPPYLMVQWLVILGSCLDTGDLELEADEADADELAAADADELAAADEEADARASRKSAAPPSSASFADAFAEILAHPGPAGGQAAPILAVRGFEIQQHHPFCTTSF